MRILGESVQSRFMELVGKKLPSQKMVIKVIILFQLQKKF